MTRLVIGFKECAEETGCSLCGRRAVSGAGPSLCRGDDQGFVCGSCGAEHEPVLAALLELGRAAGRVGRMGRHVLAPPLGALLELAHAAECYTQAGRRNTPMRRAG
jgi:hypothetical protein